MIVPTATATIVELGGAPTTATATIVELGGTPTNLATTTADQHGQAVVIVTPGYMRVAIPQGYTAGQSFLVHGPDGR